MAGKIAELIFIERIDRVIRREIRNEKRFCLECREQLTYDRPSGYWLHADGRHDCDDRPEEPQGGQAAVG